MGQCYLHRGELDAAEPLLSDALDIRYEKLGPKNVETARSWNTLGSLYEDLHHPEIAVQLLQAAAATWRELNAPLDVARCLDNLVGVQLRLGKPDLAKQAALEARELLLAHLDSGHRDVSINAGHVARSYAAGGDYVTAVQFAAAALRTELNRWHRTANQLTPRQRLEFSADLRGFLDLVTECRVKAGARDNAALRRHPTL